LLTPCTYDDDCSLYNTDSNDISGTDGLKYEKCLGCDLHKALLKFIFDDSSLFHIKIAGNKMHLFKIGNNKKSRKSFSTTTGQILMKLLRNLYPLLF
jgi:hypothetical protein